MSFLASMRTGSDYKEDNVNLIRIIEGLAAEGSHLKEELNEKLLIIDQKNGEIKIRPR